MPRMDLAPPQNRLVKLLLMGDGKIGKTYYAGAAAAAGFNVLYIDGDVGAQTLSQLPIEAQKRIFLLPVGDTILGGMRDTRFIEMMQEFTTNIKFKWNDSKSKLATLAEIKAGADEIWEITPGRMDSNTILVIDSWTGLVESIMLQAARANSVILDDATTAEMRPVYQSGALKATAMLQVIRSVPCHVIVIGHPDEYQHKVAPEGKKVKDIKENDMIVDWTKMVPKSTSRPHGLQMAKYFTDIGWMNVSPTGTRKVDFNLKSSHISGGHMTGNEDTEKFSFANLVKHLGGTIPEGGASHDEWLKIIPPGEGVVADSKVLDGTQTTEVKGLAGMFAEKKG